MQATFGRLAIRSAYRSCAVNGFGAANKLNCARNEANYAGHIWDRRDADGFMGATACIVVPWFADRYAEGADWRALAWWIHDHLPYAELCFYPSLAAFNISWHERPVRRISSYVDPKGVLTKPGMANHEGSHAEWYAGFPRLARSDARAVLQPERTSFESEDDMITTLEWRGHTIKAGLIAGTPAAQVYVGQRRATERRFGGASIEDAVEAARRWVDDKLAAAFSARGDRKYVATAAEYADYFAAHPPAEHERAMLAAHAAQSVMTATELAKAAGWKDFSSANLHYGKLGKSVSDYLGLGNHLPLNRDGSPVWTYALAVDAGDPSASEFQWRIHPELVDGLKLAGLV